MPSEDNKFFSGWRMCRSNEHLEINLETRIKLPACNITSSAETLAEIAHRCLLNLWHPYTQIICMMRQNVIIIGEHYRIQQFVDHVAVSDADPV